MKTLKSIIFLCLTSCALFLKSNAQIVYTDINPDTSLVKSYQLDLNNDGTMDFKMTRSYTQLGLGGGFAHPFIATAFVTSINSNFFYGTSGNPLALDSGVIINNNCAWASAHDTLLIHHFPNSYGNWGAATSKYLPVKYTNNGQNYFGWIKMYIRSVKSISFIISGYALNTTPNQPILAGETSCTTPTVTLSGSGPLSFCAGDSVTLTANGTGYQYQWKKDGVNITGAKSQTYIATTAGVYKCKVTNSCGSITSGGETVSVPCRISNDNVVVELEHLSIFPNPATNSATIKFPSDEAGEIQIVNLYGQIVFSDKVFSDKTKIDVNRFATGVYVVRWSSGENNESKTFSVIK